MPAPALEMCQVSALLRQRILIPSTVVIVGNHWELEIYGLGDLSFKSSDRLIH
jgi:hypothetical protein